MRYFLNRWFIISILLFGACKTSQKNTFPSAITKEAKSKHGVVVTASTLASKVGVDILKKGGNAIDAAIAVLFTLAVVYPEAGNLGGGGFLVYREQSGKTYALDFREKAPSVATKDFYLDKNGNAVDSLSQYGVFSIGVPGTVDGIFQMFEKFSKLKDLNALMTPSIEFAEKGFPLSKLQASEFNYLQEWFRRNNKKQTAFIRTKSWNAGDLFVQKELAQTLKRIAQNGRDDFYKGQTAECILNTMNSDGKTWIQREDLLAYHSVWRDPVQFNYKGYEIYSMPPPSSGGIHLAQLMSMFELSDHRDVVFHSAKHIQLFTEYERRVYADRAMYLGDPDYFEVPVKQLMSKIYLRHRIADIDLEKASDSKDFIDKNELPAESEETTHFSIIDKEGNAVSITTTLNGSFGSFVVAEGAGFLLNNEMDDFSVKPGVPNLYGLIGSEANAIEAHKRMLSSMTPTIVTKDNRVEYILGTPGGSTIITTVYQVLMNLVEFKMSPYQAVQSKRFHHQLVPDCIYFEEGDWDEIVFTELKNKNYVIKSRESIGRVELIARDGEFYIGIADERGDDSVGIP